jgi:hypothetical protein
VDCDLVIVGAGPTGLFATYYAGFRGLRVAVVDSLPELGGQITAMYPEKAIFDVAGFPSVKGRDLVAGVPRTFKRKLQELVEKEAKQNGDVMLVDEELSAWLLARLRDEATNSLSKSAHISGGRYACLWSLLLIFVEESGSDSGRAMRFCRMAMKSWWMCGRSQRMKRDGGLSGSW